MPGLDLGLFKTSLGILVLKKSKVFKGRVVSKGSRSKPRTGFPPAKVEMVSTNPLLERC